MYCANSNLLVLYIHEEKQPSNFSPNPTLELLFARKVRANCSKNTLSLNHWASNNKSEIVAHLTRHGMCAHLEPKQQPTNNPAALVYVTL
jgi:hypothetical protein